MTVVHIIPGSGGTFYCQNCVRDAGLVKALRAAGLDVWFIPMYLPLMDLAGQGAAQAPVFYGAVNVFLEQVVPFYRRLPERWRRRLDAPGVLRWAAARSGSTEAGGLGALTLSVLDGMQGRQRNELEQMVAWLRTQPRPDLFHFSNALLLGLAPVLRETFGAGIVCTLQDEDSWLDALPPRHRERAWERVRELGRSVDRFVAVSHYYAGAMQARLGLPEEQCRTIPAGVDVAEFAPPATPPELPTLGFLSELSPAHGLEHLVEAFLRLRQRPGLGALRLRVAGGDGQAATPHLRRIRALLAAAGVAPESVFADAHREGRRADFLRGLSVLSVPAVRPEAFGLFQIEAMACGVPVVQPRLGAYPEIVEATGGGVLYEGTGPEPLAAALAPLLLDRSLAARLGAAGRAAVVERFSLERMAAETAGLYRDVLAAGNRGIGDALA